MIIFVLFLGTLLVQSSVAKKLNSVESEINFDTFCQHFDQLRSTSSMNDVSFDLADIRVKLVELGLVGEQGAVDSVEEVCRDPSKAFDPECLYRNRYLWTVANSDFNRQRDPTLRGMYVDLLLLHPVFRGCLPSLNTDVKNNDVKGRFAEAMAGNNPERFAPLFEREGRRLRQEIRDLCEKKDGDETFCASLPEIVKLVDTYLRVRYDRTNQNVKWNAYRLHFVMLKQNNPDQFTQVYPTTTEELNNLLVKNLEEIFKYVGSGQFDDFSAMMSFVPDLETIGSGCETSWDLPANTKRNVCMFWRAIIQVSAYIQSTKPPASGKVKKILNTQIDYPTFLSLTEMDRILQVVQNQETALTKLAEWLNTELSKTVNERFVGLRTYFQKVESFNREKSNHDITFINSRLTKYINNINSLSSTLGEKLNKIIELAIAAVSLEIAEDTIQVGLAAAVMTNPLEKLVGGSSAGDFTDRAAKLAQTLTRVGELIRVSRTFNELKTKTEDISDRFKENSDTLETIRVLITGDDTTTDFETRKQKFLTNYGAYDPQVEKPELTGMSTTWENLIDAACEVILDSQTALAQTTVSWVRSSGICLNTKILAQEMFETYGEIYDFQFVLIETMATYMRAETSIDAAESITTGYEESSAVAVPADESVVFDLKFLSMVSFISYKINLWEITGAYCDILEYKEGGVRPSVCQGVNTNVANLVAHISPVCRNVEDYKDMPRTNATGDDRAFMNISKLYSGKSVTFKIPNGKWLVDNRWINSQDEHAAIYVKKLEVFLPTVSVTERMVRVEASITGQNQLTPPDGKGFVIVPARNFIFEYQEGQGAQPCRKESEALTNPYGASLPKICPLNVDENNCQELLEKTPLFPSVYSQWRVSLSGYQSATVPDPATVLNLKVGVKLCILNRSSDHAKKTNVKTFRDGAKKKRRDSTSCPDGQYRAVGTGACTPCPEGSKSALGGYYCEKIKKKE